MDPFNVTTISTQFKVSSHACVNFDKSRAIEPLPAFVGALKAIGKGYTEGPFLGSHNAVELEWNTRYAVRNSLILKAFPRRG